MRTLLILISACFIAACSTGRGPIELDKASKDEHRGLYYWQGGSAQAGCIPFAASDETWGQTIGCQGIETIDVRSNTAKKLVNRRLEAQGCESLCNSPSCSGTKTDRSYVRTQQHFITLDTETNTLWYVPEGYYSDGLSIPSWSVPIFAFFGQGTADADTLPSALAHDRYLCLKRYTQEENKILESIEVQNEAELQELLQASSNGTTISELEIAVKNLSNSQSNTLDEIKALSEQFSLPENFVQRANLIATEGRDIEQATSSLKQFHRRNQCSNNAFHNALRSNGSGNRITGIMRAAVGLINPGKSGYCPHNQAYEAALFLFNLNQKFGSFEHQLRTKMPECYEAEPTLLCLSSPDNLRALIDPETVKQLKAYPHAPQNFEDYIALAEQVFCLEHTATRDLQENELNALQRSNGILTARGKTSSTQELRSQFEKDERLCRQYQQDIEREMSHLSHNEIDTSNPSHTPNPFETASSPLRAGDLWIEMAPLLRESGADVKEVTQILRKTRNGEALTMNIAMRNLMEWNILNQKCQLRRAADQELFLDAMNLTPEAREVFAEEVKKNNENCDKHGRLREVEDAD